MSPRVKMGRALDAVTDADKACFERHPEQRWRVRAAEPIERQANRAVRLPERATTCGGRPDCQAWVLVLAPPSLNIRLRYFHSGEAWTTPVRHVRGAAEALAARSDEQFLVALAPHLRRPGGRS